MAVLEAAGRVGAPAGCAALLLARRLDTPTGDTGSSVAALVREHRVTLAEAVKGVAVASELDKFRERRDRKRRSAG